MNCIYDLVFCFDSIDMDDGASRFPVDGYCIYLLPLATIFRNQNPRHSNNSYCTKFHSRPISSKLKLLKQQIHNSKTDMLPILKNAFCTFHFVHVMIAHIPSLVNANKSKIQTKRKESIGQHFETCRVPR